MNQHTENIFQSLYQRLAPFHAMLQARTPVIAFSGGKDSMLLFHFYEYLFAAKLCPPPVYYHLDHSIRNNEDQEKAIAAFLEKSGRQTDVKKKTFLNWQNSPAGPWKKPDEKNVTWIWMKLPQLKPAT